MQSVLKLKAIPINQHGPALFNKLQDAVSFYSCSQSDSENNEIPEQVS